MMFVFLAAGTLAVFHGTEAHANHLAPVRVIVAMGAITVVERWPAGGRAVSPGDPLG